MGIKSYKIVTFGCQMNIADSGALGAILNAAGYLPTESEADADIIILNTCSVREHAEERVFGRLGELKRYKRDAVPKKLAVVGCMAQRLGKSILERAPYVDYVLGTDRMFDLPRYLDMVDNPHIETDFGHVNIGEYTPARDDPYSAFVTIMRGCDNYCTYCIVPYLRGHERSYAADRVLKQVREFAADGVLEVTLLGQNVNSYHDGRLDFAGLLHRVAAETDIERIRFTTSHPKDLSDELIEVMATEPKVMPHLHLAMQSGSNRILKKMGRRYTFEHYFGLVEKLRRAVPEMALTTDLIVGFPSESDEDFKSTLAAVRALQFDSAFMFRYSVREGTAAAAFDDDVPEEVKIGRLTELIDLQKEISFDKNQRETGRIRSVLVDGFSRRSRRVLKGKSGQAKTVLFDGSADLIGSVCNIEIVSADSWTLHGKRKE